MRSAEVVVDLARPGRLADLHDHLVRATADTAAAPVALLQRIGLKLRSIDLEAEELTIRGLVVMRLLAAGADDAAWLLLQDNAGGVVPETFGQSTSSGARRTARRLSLTTRIEPPQVYAWLPGFRDPRLGAPESAYDITGLVTLRARLDEMWWDRRTLVLAGTAHLRHIAAAADDVVEIVCAGANGQRHVVMGERQRRPEHVRGVGGDLTRLAWAGWSARLPARAFPAAGTWRIGLRLTESGITRAGELGGAVGDALQIDQAGPAAVIGPGRAEARITSDRLELQLAPPAHIRAARRVLHPIAGSARER